MRYAGVLRSNARKRRGSGSERWRAWPSRTARPRRREVPPAEATEVFVITSQVTPSGYCPCTRTGRARFMRGWRRRSCSIMRSCRRRSCMGSPPDRSTIGGSAGEFSVPDPVRPVGFGAQTPAAVGLVVLVVALEPDDPAVSLEGQDVGGDAVEEPAVVADHGRAAGEADQRLFEGAQRVHVAVV